MFKKVTLILSLISICALWRASSMLPDAAAQQAPGSSRPGRTSAKGTNKQINYSKFQHSSHAGMVGGVLKQTKSQELKCDYCHQDPTPEEPRSRAIRTRSRAPRSHTPPVSNAISW